MIPLSRDKFKGCNVDSVAFDVCFCSYLSHDLDLSL